MVKKCVVCGSGTTQAAHVRSKDPTLPLLIDRFNNILPMCYEHHTMFDDVDSDGILIGIDLNRRCFYAMEDKFSKPEEIPFPQNMPSLAPNYVRWKNELAHYKIRRKLGIL